MEVNEMSDDPSISEPMFGLLECRLGHRPSSPNYRESLASSVTA